MGCYGGNTYQETVTDRVVSRDGDYAFQGDDAIDDNESERNMRGVIDSEMFGSLV